jgi:GNAT superfamily N-acetyltransferase
MSGADTLPMDNPPLPFGYSPVAPGQLAQVVTFLEMTEPPAPVGAEAGPALLTRLGADDLDGYRKLFRHVGEDWLWSSRLEMSDAKLRALLGSPQVEASAVQNEGESIGLLELDFREPGTCELAFFGLVRDAIGRGFGRRMMNEAIARAWAKPIRRFWVTPARSTIRWRSPFTAAQDFVHTRRRWRFRTIRASSACCHAAQHRMFRWRISSHKRKSPGHARRSSAASARENYSRRPFIHRSR